MTTISEQSELGLAGVESRKKLPTVLMYGGGRQTIAIIVLILQGRIPMPDIICIADTEREKSSTWEYLEKYVQPNFPKQIHRIKKSDYATVDLYRETEKGEKYLLIPAFTNESGKLGKLETYCSNEWKARVCDRFIKRTTGITEWISWIGFSIDEPLRYQPKRKSMEHLVWFPLVDGVPLTKQGCVDLVKDHGWPEPKHSACWMCPLQDDQNWIDNTPEDQLKAAVLERQIQRHDKNVFLHRSLTTIDEVKFIPRKPGQPPCDSGLCMT